MSLVRRIARPMLASLFVVSGLDSLRHPGRKAPTATPLVDRVAPALGLPNDPELLVRANGATMVAGGTLLALSKFPRLASTALAATIIPTTLAAHDFWAKNDPQERAAQKIQFLKNLGLLGGLLIAAVDTEGRPGVAVRARMAGDTIAFGARRTRREARVAAKLAAKEARLRAARAGNAIG